MMIACLLFGIFFPRAQANGCGWLCGDYWWVAGWNQRLGLRVVRSDSVRQLQHGSMVARMMMLRRTTG
uniref:Putative secreted protein n=1 Tax=Anopheles triannulatus TaxID=58253 RepID=A0A2M4B7E2_9DIPT